MATIHLLRPTTISRPIERIDGDNASAQIIIFPGVRYERWADAAAVAVAKPKKKRRSRVKRDRMTIAL